MTPGPTLTYSCPVCDGCFSISTIASGNTVGAKFRSDGKMDAPMLPCTPPLLGCPHCRTLIQASTLKPVAEGAPDAFLADGNREEAAQNEYGLPLGYLPVTVDQCINYINQAVSQIDDEAGLRIYAWHLINDARIAADEFKLDAAATHNLVTLLSLLKSASEEEVLTKVEILRELGRFPEAAIMLDQDFKPALASFAEQLMLAIEAKNPNPFVFAESGWGGSTRFRWAWVARRHNETAPEESPDDLNPPLFRISNRDWWVKVLGMLSHNWALIETGIGGKAIVFFVHDGGQVRGKTPFEYRKVKDRCAIVDSLEFDSEVEAQVKLRQNGFERILIDPGPWLEEVPEGHFYDARPWQDGVYSKQGYWIRN